MPKKRTNKKTYKKQIFSDPITLKGLADFTYALPGFLPIILDPENLFDHESNYTLALKPEQFTKHRSKVKWNTLPPATWEDDQQISFINRIRYCAAMGYGLRTNIILRALPYGNHLYEIWRGFNQLQLLLPFATTYPNLVLYTKLIYGLSTGRKYDPFRAKCLFNRYRNILGTPD